MADQAFKYRLTYKKTDTARYIGHLDLLRIIQRGIRMSGLSPRYSEGFNPHLTLSFAQPLAVGMAGLGELADMEILEKADPRQIIESINERLPKGLLITGAELLPAKSKTAAALIHSAIYEIRLVYSGDADLIKAASDILAADSVVIQTEKKGKPAGEADIRPRILSLSIHDDIVTAELACGGKGNLRPEILADVICKRAGAVLDPYRTEYARIETILGDFHAK